MQTTEHGAKLLESGDYVNAAFSNADSAFNTNAGLLDTHIGGASHASQAEKALWNAKAAPASLASLTLAAGDWSGSGPYTLTAAVTGMTAQCACAVGLPPDATSGQRQTAAQAGVLAVSQAAGSLTFQAAALPGVNLPVLIWIFG